LETRHCHTYSKTWKNKLIIEVYRPVSLLNTMCEIFEKIIDTRLRWFLERINYFSPEQKGFLNHRTTENYLHDIQKDILKTFETKKVPGLVSLDIAKLYNITSYSHNRKITQNTQTHHPLK